jgi:hypothetical protein
MRRTVRFTLTLVFALSVAAVASGEEPRDISVCQLKANPAFYDHKLIEVTGFVSHAFEDFTISDPSCSSWPGVWLEYGGKANSGTIYCCGGTSNRSRPNELKIEGISSPLIDDDQFKAFDKAIHPPFRSGRHGAMIHTTLVGRYFAGKPINNLKGNLWDGFGHMGCCTLLVIQEVKAADTLNHPQLDYRASPEQPEVEKVGCGYRYLLPLDQVPTLLKWQQQADSGDHEFVFDNPKQVAVEMLSKLVNVDAASLSSLSLLHEAQGRKLYVWKPAGKSLTYTVVVSRPYWVSFYSHDPERVAWAPIAAYESSCGGKNAVTRIK